jgi:hypothetical protein
MHHFKIDECLYVIDRITKAKIQLSNRPYVTYTKSPRLYSSSSSSFHRAELRRVTTHDAISISQTKFVNEEKPGTLCVACNVFMRLHITYHYIKG